MNNSIKAIKKQYKDKTKDPGRGLPLSLYSYNNFYENNDNPDVSTQASSDNTTVDSNSHDSTEYVITLTKFKNEPDLCLDFGYGVFSRFIDGNKHFDLVKFTDDKQITIKKTEMTNKDRGLPLVMVFCNTINTLKIGNNCIKTCIPKSTDENFGMTISPKLKDDSGTIYLISSKKQISLSDDSKYDKILSENKSSFRLGGKAYYENCLTIKKDNRSSVDNVVLPSCIALELKAISTSMLNKNNISYRRFKSIVDFTPCDLMKVDISEVFSGCCEDKESSIYVIGNETLFKKSDLFGAIYSKMEDSGNKNDSKNSNDSMISDSSDIANSSDIKAKKRNIFKKLYRSMKKVILRNYITESSTFIIKTPPDQRNLENLQNSLMLKPFIIIFRITVDESCSIDFSKMKRVVLRFGSRKKSAPIIRQSENSSKTWTLNSMLHLPRNNLFNVMRSVKFSLNEDFEAKIPIPNNIFSNENVFTNIEEFRSGELGLNYINLVSPFGHGNIFMQAAYGVASPKVIDAIKMCKYHITNEKYTIIFNEINGFFKDTTITIFEGINPLNQANHSSNELKKGIVIPKNTTSIKISCKDNGNKNYEIDLMRVKLRIDDKNDCFTDLISFVKSKQFVEPKIFDIIKKEKNSNKFTQLFKIKVIKGASSFDDSSNSKFNLSKCLLITLPILFCVITAVFYLGSENISIVKFYKAIRNDPKDTS
ncbi:MAG: hypothetical protein MHPSP_001029, partial [Paramarteilia canceri]